MDKKLYQKQSGAALFIALIILLVLTIIGLSASQRSSLQERMAANMHMGNVTFSAAESAVGVFFAIANKEGSNKGEYSHILNKIGQSKVLENTEVDQSGELKKAAFFDKDTGGGQLKAKFAASILHECKICAGNSVDGDVNCRVIQVTGTGEIHKNSSVLHSSSVVMTGDEVVPCQP